MSASVSCRAGVAAAAINLPLIRRVSRARNGPSAEKHAALGAAAAERRPVGERRRPARGSPEARQAARAVAAAVVPGAPAEDEIKYNGDDASSVSFPTRRSRTSA